jgi:2,4-dichlorophenol 6-monooxygenase
VLGHELTGLEQDGQGVRATIRDNASGRQYAVRCQYLIGADGGRRVAGLIGVGYEGLGVVTQTATLHVSADFAPWARDPDVLIRCIGTALGISPENTPEQNMAQLRRMWSGRPEDAAHRSAVLRAMRAQSMVFSELNVEYGYSYQSAAVVPDGSAAPAPADDIRVYQPSTRPGAPLPHAWVEDEDGCRRPVKDLVTPGRFLLIAGEDGQAWCAAARQLAEEADLPLDAVRIGHLDGELYDPRCTWLRHRQIATDGAVLVRPDRFITWRHQAGSDEPWAVLAAALSQILARPVCPGS